MILPDIEPERNGHVEEPPKPARKRKKKEPVVASSTNPVPQEDEPVSSGRKASEIAVGNVTYLLKPWIPERMLSLVIGLPAVGKSTFLAWLAFKAGRVCYLPGFEESPGISTIPRLKAQDADLDAITFLDDRDYKLPRDKKLIAKIVSKCKARLLIMDPINSYMEDAMSENDGRHVRMLLEGASWIGEKTGAAVVGVRHPGKDRHNPLPGSREWRAVPRSIVELLSDGGTPPRLMLSHFKDSHGNEAKPRRYRLDGEAGSPRRFVLGDSTDSSMQDLAMVASDPTGRRKVMDAARLIRHMFESEEKPAVADYVKTCGALGIGETAREEAKRLLAIRSTPEAMGGKWLMTRTQKEWPKWLLETDSGR